MFRHTLLRSMIVAALLAGGAAYSWFGGYFARELVTEAAILAILVISLDLVAGFGGMISLCHGAILGIGAYTFASATALFGLPPSVAFAAAILTSALFGFLVGAVTSRTHGIFFIMASLAFGQMVHSYVFTSPYFGGDDGMSGVRRLDLSWIGIDFQGSMEFAFVALAGVLVAYLVAGAVLTSGFGRSLVGIRSNEVRMRAFGLTIWRHKAIAFAISGALAGFAGTLAAQHTMFVSPELMSWTVSGEALVVVILGGLGTLAGPAAGAALFVFLKHEVSALTAYWHMVVGIVLILAVVGGGRGLLGQIEHALRRPERRPEAMPEAGHA